MDNLSINLDLLCQVESTTEGMEARCTLFPVKVNGNTLDEIRTKMRQALGFYILAMAI